MVNALAQLGRVYTVEVVLLPPTFACRVESRELDLLARVVATFSSLLLSFSSA